MREVDLQSKLVEIISNQEFLEFINNQELLDQALMKDNDPLLIPTFSIDSLLKEKYSRSAKRVLDSLDYYELVSGEMIKNISLNKSERLYPDLILFNPYKCQITIIENKISSQTEREAITELFGYVAEIRNHLPFLSDYDINYILISTEFNALLDHSVSGQILNSDINLLCLKPVVDELQISGLEVYFPNSWSDIGQNGFPENALVSYTLCLYTKDEVEVEDFDEVSVIRMAMDLILSDANKYKSSGFYIVWKNGLSNNIHDCKYAITLYILHSAAFLPDAQKLGFPLNNESALSKYLMDYYENYDTTILPASIFGISDQAKSLLDKYYDVQWDRQSNWSVDSSDMLLSLQRRVLDWDSWGLIGDYVRRSYLHPSNTNLYSKWELQYGRGYRNPYIGLQIIQHIASDTVFKYGEFSHQELFRFAVQIGLYKYACLNAMSLNNKSEDSMEAFLFWTVLPLTHSLKEVEIRVNNSVELNSTASFPVALSKSAIGSDYNERIESFIKWFSNDFINEKENATLATIFRVVSEYALFFIPFFKPVFKPEQCSNIERDLASIVRMIVKEIAIDRLKNPSPDIGIIEFLSAHYFNNKLMQMDANDIGNILDSQSDQTLSEGFYDIFLKLLDSIKGVLAHRLDAGSLSDSIDLNALYQSATKMFDEGNTNLAIIIGRNGKVGLGKIQSPMRLNNREEIFIQFYPGYSTMEMVLRKKWADLLSGDYKLKL